MNLFNSLLAIIMISSMQAIAGTPDSIKVSKEKITIKIIREKDGKTTVFDSSFVNAEAFNLSDFLKQQKIETSSSNREEEKGNNLKKQVLIINNKDVNGATVIHDDEIADLPELINNTTSLSESAIHSENKVMLYEYQSNDKDLIAELLIDGGIGEDELNAPDQIRKTIRIIQDSPHKSSKNRRKRSTQKRIIIIEE